MSRIENGHIAPFDFMRFADGEMSALEQEALLLHVDTCAQCARSFVTTQKTLERLTAVVPSATAGPAMDGSSSARLRAGLEQLVEAKQERVPWYHGILHNRRYASYAVLLLLIAISMGGIAYRHAHSVEAEAVLLPNRSLTPGAVRSVALAELCQVVDNDDLDPVVSVPTQKAIFHEYGIPPEQSRVNFQMDYLINPQLGGVDDVRNLWPQPYSSEWNARAKDELERHLHQMVCDHKIELADAQREIAENWIDAYKKYFHTSKPI
ncbi:MAG TPA: zf-HC2 domain-containing protein [Edaphobacter sp.]